METLHAQLGIYRNERKKEVNIPWEAVVRFKRIDHFENGWHSYQMFVLKDEDNNLKIQDFDRLITESGNTVFFHDHNILVKGEVAEIETVRVDTGKDFTIARFDRCIKKIEENPNPIVKKLITPNRRQKHAVLKMDRVIPQLKQYSILGVEGCPGAGKSTLCSLFIKKFYQKYKIIYLAPTHEQIQNMVSKLVNTEAHPLIMSDESKLDKSLTKYHNSNRSDYNPKFKNLIPSDDKVIISTVNKPLKGLTNLDKTMVIIDEAGKVSVIEALSALYTIKKLVFLIFAGDSRQLGCHSNNNAKIESCLEFLQRCDSEIWELRNQFRFGEMINYPISTLFYESKMTAMHKKTATCIYIEMKGCNHDKQVFCTNEASLVKHIFKYVSDVFSTRIITPYSKQQTCLSEKGLNSISIDSAQGSEFDATIVSFGRNQGRGFLTRKRLNVALTRASNILVIIAHEDLKKSISELEVLHEIASINNNLIYFRSES